MLLYMFSFYLLDLFLRIKHPGLANGLQSGLAGPSTEDLLSHTEIHSVHIYENIMHFFSKPGQFSLTKI